MRETGSNFSLLDVDGVDFSKGAVSASDVKHLPHLDFAQSLQPTPYARSAPKHKRLKTHVTRTTRALPMTTRKTRPCPRCIWA